jgi:hypothetical protein
MSAVFAVSGDWALGADSLQWILYRRRSRAKSGWRAVSFVGSTREVLARCMGEEGRPDEDRAVLLEGLPPTFDQWRKTRQSSSPPVWDCGCADAAADKPTDGGAA